MRLKNRLRRNLVVGAAAGLAVPAWALPAPDLRAQLQGLVEDPAALLAGLSVLVQRRGRTVFEAQFGRRYIAPLGQSDLPVTEDTLFRVASVSKIVVALAVMRLVDAEKLSLDADISASLGYRVRHPSHPGVPITPRLLLSHRSSLTDSPGERPKPGQLMQAALTHDRKRWAKQSPGTFFQYCNFNYGVLASVIERVSGQRFDRFAVQQVLRPLGMQGSFDVAALPRAQLANLAALYRKFDGKTWRSDGPWVAQIDDVRAKPPEPLPGLAHYELGSNGSLFGPQGGLRTRVRDLARVTAMFNGGGVQEGGQRFLSYASVQAMTTEQWRLDAAARNGDDEAGEFQAWGVGLQHYIDQSRSGWGDRLVPGGGQQAWGHPGFAWGLQAGLMFDPLRQIGVIYVISGTGANPEVVHGIYSSYAPWEERLQELLWAAAG